MVHTFLADTNPSAHRTTMKQYRSYLAITATERSVFAPSDRLCARHGMGSLENPTIATSECGRGTRPD
jgi:hypothetical protein